VQLSGLYGWTVVRILRSRRKLCNVCCRCQYNSLEEAGNLINKCSIGPKLSPYVDPKALSSGKEVVSTPEFFDEWLHDYRNPSEVVPCSPLDISIDNLADSQYDPQIACMYNDSAPLPMHHTLR